VYNTETSSSHLLIEKTVRILNSGDKIVILVGRALQSGAEVIAVAEKLGAPVVKALLGKAVIPDDDVHSFGGIGLLGTEPSSNAMSEADTLFMVETSFPYTDYLPKPGQARGIQIDLKPEKIDLRYPDEIGLIGDSKIILSELLPLLVQKENQEFLKSKQQEMKKWNILLEERSSRTDNPIKPQVIAKLVSDELEENSIVSVDCGTNTSWAARYINIPEGMKFSISCSLSSMGNGLPYAIAAQIAYPDRQSIAFVGDGGLTMLMGEFATAVQYSLPIKVIVIKNDTLGMIRWEQIGFLGNPEFGVEFSPIDFAKFAESCGGKGYSIRKTSEAKSIIQQAMREKRPTLIEAYVDPFEPPMPPKVGMEYVNNLAESFAKGQPYAGRIGLTLFRDKVHEVLKNIHTHSSLSS
jgi:pyruvate dehydrogenase (quinone)